MSPFIKRFNPHPATFNLLARFPATIILQQQSVLLGTNSTLNPTYKMASSKPITDFFPPSKRSKVVASAASSSFEPSFKRSSISVLQKPTTTVAAAAASTPPESIDDDDGPAKVSSLTAEQKLRVQLNQSLAKAKRNLRVCAERVQKSTPGLFVCLLSFVIFL
ncbi:putative uracil-DNA glycosylase [Helianthus annuus]|nr:putative uracil-DNA glycosylase [Helianthus annuus]